MANGQPILLWACVSQSLFDELDQLDRSITSPKFSFNLIRRPAELLERHASSAFDYLILEDGLSGMSADLIAQPMRSALDIRPVIVIGAACDARTVTSYIRAGVDDYLVRTDICVKTLKESMRFAKEAEMRRKSERDVRQVLTQLGAADNYSRMLIEHSSDMVIAVDLALRITEFNRAAERSFGYERESMIGQHVSILYADHNQAWPVRMQTFKSGFIGEVRNRRKNGEVFISGLHACKVVDAEGDLVGVIGMSREIRDESNTLAGFQSVHEQFVRRTETLNRRECQIAEIERLDRVLVTRITDLARHQRGSTALSEEIDSALDELRTEFDMMARDVKADMNKVATVAVDRWFEQWRMDAAGYAGLTVASNDHCVDSIACDMERMSHVLNRLVEALSRSPDSGIAMWPPEVVESARGPKFIIRLTASIAADCRKRLQHLFATEPADLPPVETSAAILELRILMIRRIAVAAGFEIDGEMDEDDCVITVSALVKRKGGKGRVNELQPSEFATTGP